MLSRLSQLSETLRPFEPFSHQRRHVHITLSERGRSLSTHIIARVDAGDDVEPAANSTVVDAIDDGIRGREDAEGG